MRELSRKFPRYELRQRLWKQYKRAAAQKMARAEVNKRFERFSVVCKACGA